MAILEHLKRRLSGNSAEGTEETLEECVSAALPEPDGADPAKTPYTHGLDRIYALENVDVRTVRPMRAAPAEKETHAQILVPVAVDDEPQLPLCLGPQATGRLTSFRLREPIEVLQLSAMAQKGLEANGYETIGDLVKADRQQLVFTKGLGQGHVDEMEQKLKNYLGPDFANESSSVDLVSMLRSLLGRFPAIKLAACLEPYGLGHLFPVTAAGDVELRHLSDEKRALMVRETLQEIASESRRKEVKRQLQQVFDAFILRWMLGRQGLATGKEITERIERVSQEPELAKRILHFIGEAFFGGRDPLQHALLAVEEGVFAVDQRTKEQALLVLRTVDSYFYRSDVWYPLEQVVSLVERELGRHWLGFAEGFVEKTLRLSRGFVVCKGIGGLCVIKP